jgi:hypothetical protein
MLDAPVSGSVHEAESGTLTIMVGGDDQAFATVERCCTSSVRPSDTSERTARVYCSSSQSTSASRPDARLQRGRPARRARRHRPRAGSRGDGRELDRVAAPARPRSASSSTSLDQAWFDVELAHKDIRLALATGSSEHVPLPSAALADEWFTKATALGYGHRDVASLFAVLAETSAARPGA